MPQPLVPPSKYNPTGTTTLQRRTNAELGKRFRRYYKGLREIVEAIPYTRTERRSNWIEYAGNAKYRYKFDLSPELLRRINDQIGQLTRMIFFDGQDEVTQNHFFSQAAELGYESGVRQELRNLQTQTGGQYIRTIDYVLRSTPYRNRIAFVGARAFEDLKGFTDEMRGTLRTILVNGMSRGLGPNDLVADIRDQVLGDKDGKRKGAERRAKLLARTEITEAHRRAIYDEHLAANEEGLDLKLMHISALIPDRTRRTHAVRHGKLVTTEEQEEWYSQDGNAIACLCTSVSVAVGKDGEPLNQKFVERQLKRRQVFVDSTEPTA
jgi:hypothetical protein